MPTALAMMQAERAKYAEKLGRLKLDDIHRLLDLMDIVPHGTGSKVPWRWLRAADCIESSVCVLGGHAAQMVCQRLRLPQLAKRCAAASP